MMSASPVQAAAAQLVDAYSDEALSVVLEMARLVALELARRERERPPPLRVVETAAHICQVVANQHGLTVMQLKARDRTQQTSRVRSLAMHLMRTRLGLSFADIGAFFGRDHSSVMTACARVNVSSPRLQRAIDELDERNCEKRST